MSSLFQDLRFAFRTLDRERGFAALTIGTLAVGIGTTAAVFSVVWHVLLAPLPFPDADRLMMIWETHPDEDYPRTAVAPPNADDWARDSQTFERIGIYTSVTTVLSAGDRTEAFSSAHVSARLMDTVGVRPRLGRTLTTDDERNTTLRPVLISERVWRDWFAGRPDVVGRVVRLNDRAAEIVGVMPESFRFPPPVSFLGVTEERAHHLWIPVDLSASRGAHYVMALGRLHAGVSLATADAELKTIAAGIAERHPENRGWSTQVVPLHEELAGPVRPGIGAAFGAAGCVFLLACANVANLLLARGTRRRREMAVRTALGASRRRLVRQLGVEALVMGGAGALAGALLAGWLVRAAVWFGPSTVPRLASAVIDTRVLLFTLAAGLLSAVLIALLPAWIGTGARPVESLRERSHIGGRAGGLQRTLVGAEIALAVVLLVGSLVLVNGFLQLRRVDLGYRTDDVATMRVSLTGERYRTNEARIAMLREVMQRLEGSPEIRTAGASDSVPLTARQGSSVARADEEGGRRRLSTQFSFVTPGYFETIGIPLRRGRLFTAAEGTTPRSILLNETAARQLFADSDPIGQRVRTGFERDPRVVVGLVGDERHVGPRRSPDANVYIPAFEYGWTTRLTIAARAQGPPEAALARMRAVVRELDPALAPYDVRTMRDSAAEVLGTERFLMLLLVGFAAAALTLAVVGVYGTTTYYVVQQARDFAIRVALGASGADIARHVLGRVATVGVAGGAGGLVLLLLVRPAIDRMLPDAAGIGAGVAVSAALVLTLLALLAAAVPAVRAMRANPLDALRH